METLHALYLQLTSNVLNVTVLNHCSLSKEPYHHTCFHYFLFYFILNVLLSLQTFESLSAYKLFQGGCDAQLPITERPHETTASAKHKFIPFFTKIYFYSSNRDMWWLERLSFSWTNKLRCGVSKCLFTWNVLATSCSFVSQHDLCLQSKRTLSFKNLFSLNVTITIFICFTLSSQ